MRASEHSGNSISGCKSTYTLAGESVIANVGTYTCSCAELDLRAVVVPSLMAAMNDIIRLGKLLRQSIDRLMPPEREAILLPLALG